MTNMKKTKAGISIGAFGAVVYFSALLGGYIPLFLLAGYIFLKEDNVPLKRAAFKAISLMLVFSALGAVVDMLNEILGIFNCLLEWEMEIPLNLDRVFKNTISIAKTILFSILGFKALEQKDVPIQTIDNALCCDTKPTADVNNNNLKE